MQLDTSNPKEKGITRNFKTYTPAINMIIYEPFAERHLDKNTSHRAKGSKMNSFKIPGNQLRSLV